MRYSLIADEIRLIGARRLVEIGTCQGATAELMIRAALELKSDIPVEYYGFDLFDRPPDYELSAKKQPAPIETVRNRLAELEAEVTLVKGNSKKTVPAAALEGIDLVFVDGGHSEETIANDFRNALRMTRKGGAIILDDYWNYPQGGCNALVDGLDRHYFDVEILEPADVFNKPYGTLKINLVRIRL